MNPYALAYREQHQLFLYDKTYLAGALLKVGGLSTVMARFIVQFFWNPTVAVILTVTLLALSSFLLWIFIRTSRHDWSSMALSLIPACFIAASLSDNCLHYDYLISLMLIEIGLVIYKTVKCNRGWLGILLTLVLYVISGPSAIIFAICCALSEIKRSGSFRTPALLLPIIAAACGFSLFLLSAVPTLASAFTPSFHYDIGVGVPFIHWLGWISIPAVTAISQIGRRKVILPAGIILFSVSLILCIGISRQYEKEAVITGYEYEYYTVNGRWDDLEKSCSRHVRSHGSANYLNLASAYRGTLTDNLLKYDNRGASALLLMTDDIAKDVRAAHILFAMGNMAAAQDVAFNIMFGPEGFAPAMLKMNAQIEIMRGNYAVAEKYLTPLKKSLRYSSWARDKMRFLYDDEAVEADNELGRGRKSFNVGDGFTMFESPLSDLLKILRVNPYDGMAMQYALSYLLLKKDINGLFEFVDEFYGKGLTALPPVAQEAMVFFSGYYANIEERQLISNGLSRETIARYRAADRDWCLSHGVMPETFARFDRFQQAQLSNVNLNSSAEFRHSYWKYLLFTEI